MHPQYPQPGQQPATGPSQGQGYPENTPLEQMTTDQREAYWRAQARKWEDRAKARADYDAVKAKAEQYDQLAAATMTDQQRQIADAAAKARTDAIVEQGGKLVEGWVRAAAAGRLDEQRVSALLSGLDRRAFVNATTGEVDTDKVYAYVNSVAPAQQPAPQYPVAAAAPGQQPVTGIAPGYAPVPVPGQPVFQPAMGVAPVYAAPGQQPAYPAGVPGYPQQPVYGAPVAPNGFPVPGMPVVPGQAPDFGQGQPQTPQPTGLAAGKAVAAARYGDRARSNGGAAPAGAAPAQQ